MMMQPRHPEKDPAGDAFWRFSLALYARPGVTEALLALQDRAGHDVNLILFGLWLGIRNRRLTGADVAAAGAAIAPANSAAIAPLRRLRRQLKGVADHDLAALRRRVAVLELAAERLVQYRLAEDFPGVPAPPGKDGTLALAEANLVLCLGADAASPEARVLGEALAALTRAGRRATVGAKRQRGG